MTDIASIDFSKVCEDGATLILRHPFTGEVLTNSEGKEMTITVIGESAPSFKQVMFKLQNARMAKMRRATKDQIITAEELFSEDIELLAQTTKGWANLEMNGKPLEFSVAAARDLYGKIDEIRRQVKEFQSDQRNFLKN